MKSQQAASWPAQRQLSYWFREVLSRFGRLASAYPASSAVITVSVPWCCELQLCTMGVYQKENSCFWLAMAQLMQGLLSKPQNAPQQMSKVFNLHLRHCFFCSHTYLCYFMFLWSILQIFACFFRTKKCKLSINCLLHHYLYRNLSEDLSQKTIR